jgi:carbon-monoxide dehydrogenase medium subunit
MNNFDYFKPASLNEAWELYEKYPGARYIAGGTDLMVKIKNRLVKPSTLISMRSIPELSGIEIGDKIRIGAMTTLTELIAHEELGRVCPLLIRAASSIGSSQIRNVATAGGNLCNCSPCADIALPLLVMEARAVIKSQGTSREIPLSDFFIGPGESCLTTGEILSEFVLDKPSADARTVFMKKTRVKMDLSIASVAALLEMNGNTCRKARFAAGSVAPVPKRLTGVEDLLTGTPAAADLSLKAQEIAVEEIAPITDIRSTVDYRRQIIGVFVKRTVEELMDLNG